MTTRHRPRTTGQQEQESSMNWRSNRIGIVFLGGLLALSLVSPAPAQETGAPARAHFKRSGVTLTVQKTVDAATGLWSVSAVDAQGNPADYASILRHERELAAQPAAKIVAPLAEYLEAAGGQPLIVGVWLRFDPRNVDHRPALETDLAAGVAYPEARNRMLARLEAGNAAAVDPARALFNAMAIPVASAARYAPLVFVRANAEQVEALSQLEIVEGLYADVVFRDLTEDAIGTHRWNRVHDFNIRGDGVKVAVLEDNGIDDAACGILNVVGWNNANHNIQDHPTGSASVIGSMDATHPGHARGIQILSANGTTAGGAASYATSDIIAASDWAIGQGADVVNCSFGFTSTPLVLQQIDRYVDYQVRFSTATFAVSAGNAGGGSNDVSSPAVSWNCIAVGAMDDANTPDWADDVMAGYSSFDDPTSLHNDREKPEVSAEGTNMTLLNLGCSFTYFASGTSFAAPGVAGMCGALMQVDATLRGWPEAMKAVMMAAASHNLEGASALSDVDGAGGMNGLQAYRMVEQGKFAIGTFNASSFSNNGYFTYDVYLQGGDKARICLVWDSLASGPAAYATDVLNADLDLAIYAGQGQTGGTFLAGSASWDNSYEIVEFCPPSTGWYTIRVNDYRFDGLSEYYAIAWTQQADGRYVHFRNWLPDSSLETTGPVIGNSYFWLDPIDFANGNKTYFSVASAGIGTGVDLPAACRHSYGDLDFLTQLLMDPSNPFFIDFFGTWSSSGTTYSHRFAIPDAPEIVGIPIYLSILTGAPGAPEGILEIGEVEKLAFWSHATELTLGDDGFTGPIDLGFSFPFYGGTYTQVYVNANGNVTFGGGDSDYSESPAELTAGLPRIAPLWDDLNMNIGGNIRYRTCGTQQFVVEWCNVPEFSQPSTNHNSVTLVLNADGTIEFWYLDCAALDAVVGISPGGGAGSTTADLSHGNTLSFYGNAFYEHFTGVGSSTLDLDTYSYYRGKLRFQRLSAFNYRATYETP
jgi:hypothetical protein